MKRSLLILAFLAAIHLPVNAQKPEKVYSIIKVYKEYDWYTQQYGLWETETSRHKKDVEGWVNLYAAARMARFTAPNETENEKWNDAMVTVIERMEKAIPKTYEYYYIKAWDTSIWEATDDGEQQVIASYAMNAYKLDPNRPQVYPDLMNYYMVKRNVPKMQEIAKKWVDTDDISANIYAMNYNMLMSTEKNSILLTAGDNDTYPAVVLQNGKNVRPDVSVMNIYLAAFSAEYRNNIFKELGIPALNGEVDQTDVINHIVKNKGDYPLFFAFGNYFSEMDTLKDKLYNVGMAMYYSENNYNNTSALINNFENKFLIDHLKFSLVKDQFPEQVKRHNLTYIPGLIILYNHYKITEQTRKKEDIQTLILNLVKDTPHEEDMKTSLGC